MSSFLDSVDFVELRWVLEDKYQFTRAQAIDLVEQFRHTRVLSPEYLDDAHALAEGMPVAYVIGWVDFLGCRIDLSHKPLIPRPETEIWVEQFIATQHMRQKAHPTETLRVLDLCCGSGCVGLALMKHLPNAHVTFVDIEPEMLKQTAVNAQKNHFSSVRYDLVTSDLFSGVEGRFDVILTNPPYVDPFGEISPSLKFEPARALFAQNGGLSLIELIFSDAGRHLEIEGDMYIEFAADQGERVQEIAKQYGWKIRVIQDQFLRDRYAICRPMLNTQTSHRQN